MTIRAQLVELGEILPWPDAWTRYAIRRLVARTARQLAALAPDAEADFAKAMRDYPVALHTAAANAQHYEVPADFFALVLGPQRKYSCCLYDGATTLADAEERALSATAEHADLADGQSILELGCGWGSLSLWMARRYPNAKIVAVSNSKSQRNFIVAQAASQSLTNLSVVTADVNTFAPPMSFDRVVSVEMFEHMANWGVLLGRIRTWLAADGKLFLHVFSHRHAPYRFDDGDDGDWIAQHFFTGGLMPSHGLIRHFSHVFKVAQEWRWNGLHYQRTAQHWLENFDRNSTAINRQLDLIYGRDAELWRRRWRLFFLATAGLFGHADGEEWGVSHYSLTPSG